MKVRPRGKYLWPLLVVGCFVTAPAFAEKPDWAGKPGGGAHEMRKGDRGDDNPPRREESRKGKRHDYRDDRRAKVYFEDRHRVIVREYYDERFRAGRCPPGLAKKHNGCMPPGLAKKWHKGRPLPRDVIYYDLPRSVIIRLGEPPAGHKYVRVATDILLIAIGTGIVVDAIEDLMR